MEGCSNLKLDNLSDGQVLGAIFGGAGGAILLYAIFWYPYLYKLVLEDWTLKTYHVFLGPLLWKRGEVPPIPEGHKVQIVIDYYEGNRTREEYENAIDSGLAGVDPKLIETRSESHDSDDLETKGAISTSIEGVETNPTEKPIRFDMIRKENFMIMVKTPKYWPRLVWLALTNGVRQDVVNHQRNDTSFLGKNVQDMHARAKKYDNKTEHLFSLLQGLTAGTASFAHGANDISNAAGPLSTIYLVWSTNTSGRKAEVPVWVLCYTAAALCIGLWTYGYNLMRNLGNKLTLQSPSRGFNMELGAAITVVFATRLSLPVSTTQCLVGAVVFVGLCNGDVKAVNWRMVAWSYMGWFLTVPCAGLIAGIIMGIICNAPKVGVVYEMS